MLPKNMLPKNMFPKNIRFQAAVFLPLLLLFSMLSTPVRAQSSTFGDYELHYSAFNSKFLLPDVARAYGIERSNRLGLINISLLKSGKPVKADVKVEAANLMAQRTELKPWLVDEGNAIYYLATFKHTNDELLHFTIRASPENSKLSETVKFSQKFYKE